MKCYYYEYFGTNQNELNSHELVLSFFKNIFQKSKKNKKIIIIYHKAKEKCVRFQSLIVECINLSKR